MTGCHEVVSYGGTQNLVVFDEQQSHHLAGSIPARSLAGKAYTDLTRRAPFLQAGVRFAWWAAGRVMKRILP
jgi:hypothetical protein